MEMKQMKLNREESKAADSLKNFLHFEYFW